MKMELRGSYTVEAALVLPLIFSAIAVVLVLGMKQASGMSAEMVQIREAWQMEGQINLPERLRIGQAAADLFGEE